MIADGHKLSPLYRALADFALSHPDELAFSTAAELARRVGASEATVIRLPGRSGIRDTPSSGPISRPACEPSSPR